MNRADRRRTARLGNIVRLEIFDQLRDLIVRAFGLPPVVVAIAAAIGTDQPPLCGGCGTELAETPQGWGVVVTDKVEVCGFCVSCLEGDRIALGRAVLAEFGAELIEPSRLHLDKRGRA